MTILRYEPLNHVMSLSDARSQLLRDSFVGPFGRAVQATNIMPVDVYETGESVVVKAFMPGLTPDELTISLDQQTLTMHGEPQQQALDGMRTILQERPTVAFTRTLSLPATVDAEKVQAELANGVLTLTLPKSEAARPRKIQIKAD